MSDMPNVRLRAVYKIFGAQSGQMMDHVREVVSKEALLSDHSHVLGLQDVNFDMKADEITVVMGLSGSGRSTLIRHPYRLIEPTAGEVLLHGKDITALSRTALRDMRRKNMAMVFQKFALLPHRTVLQDTATALAVQGASAADQAAGFRQRNQPCAGPARGIHHAGRCDDGWRRRRPGRRYAGKSACAIRR